MDKIIEEIVEGFMAALLPWLQHWAQTPATMVDAKADPAVKQELQDDLESQIANGSGAAPA